MKFRSSGDGGDICHSLAILNALGGEHEYFLVNRGWTKNLTSLAHVYAPLLESQKYVSKVACSEADVDVDFSKFRFGDSYHFHSNVRSLAWAHQQFYNHVTHSKLEVDWSKPWLTGFEPDIRGQGRVIIARSQRYNGPHMRWEEVMRFYGDKVAFIGIRHEWETFTRNYGPCEFIETKTLLEVAQLMAACDLVIANQSAPYAVAEGMRVRRIVETAPTVIDVITWVDNKVQFVADGYMVLPNFEGGDDLVVQPRRDVSVKTYENHTVPPGYWQYPVDGEPPITHTHVSALADVVSRRFTMDKRVAEVRILEHNIQRCPDFFRTSDETHADSLLQQALKNAPTHEGHHPVIVRRPPLVTVVS